MVGAKRYSILLVLLGFIISTPSKAQVDAFATVRINKRSVYAQEPIRATVTVYTATWFTQPLEFNNIQIPNAFILPFSRTIPGVYQIRGKQYAGLEFYYIIYPYKPGSYEIPVINVVAETPPQGDYKGRRVTLKTQSIKYTVKENPEKYGNETWFVARYASIHSTWNRSTGSLKVGDFITRTTTIHAQGTLPNFIPELKPVSPDGVSVYPEDPHLIDQRNENEANGSRIEKTTFLFEREGEVIIPGETIQWWDPVRQRVMKRHTTAVKITILPNPDLGMLATVRDSLDTKQPVASAQKSKGPFLILGIPWKKFLIVCLATAIVIYSAFKLVRYLIRRIISARKNYRQTEAYWFRKFMRSGERYPTVINTFYAWWDRLRGQRSSLQESSLNKSIINDWLTITGGWRDPGSPVSGFRKKISALRNEVKQLPAHEPVDDHQRTWN